MNINHIGIVVKNINESSEYYQIFFQYSVSSEIFFDPIQKVIIQFLHSKNNKATIELIEPADDDSPVANTLGKGGGLNHLCYEVGDIEKTITEFKSKGCRLISGPVPAVAFNNKRVAFLYTRQRELIEFVEILNV